MALVQPEPLGEHRRPTREEQEDKGYVLTFSSSERGESADYLTARIARDRPDILEDMQAGK